MLATLGMTSALSSALGGQLLGWLCEAVGPRGTLVLAGAVTAIACLVAGVAFAARHNYPLRPAEVGRTLMAGVRHVPEQRAPRPTGRRRPGRLVGPRIAGRAAHAPVVTHGRVAHGPIAHGQAAQRAAAQP
jgi:hypothetical protein